MADSHFWPITCSDYAMYVILMVSLSTTKKFKSFFFWKIWNILIHNITCFHCTIFLTILHRTTCNVLFPRTGGKTKKISLILQSKYPVISKEHIAHKKERFLRKLMNSLTEKMGLCLTVRVDVSLYKTEFSVHLHCWYKVSLLKAFYELTKEIFLSWPQMSHNISYYIKHLSKWMCTLNSPMTSV